MRPQFAVRHHRRGLVSKPDGLGNPTPTGSTVPFLLFPSAAFFASLRRCVKFLPDPLSHVAPLGFGYLVYAVFYKHAAPLGLNAAMHRLPFAHCIHMRPSGAEGGTIGAGHPSWGRVISLDGLGNPTPTDSSVPFLLFLLCVLCVFASLR